MATHIIQPNRVCAPLALLLFTLLAHPLANAHDDASPRADPQLEALAEGGRLYDKWWAEYDLSPPSETHPAYPARGAQSGANTWRCKECHGWDYRGQNGAYASGSHYTGIRGIERFDGGNPDRVYRILTDRTHRYDQVMREPALRLISEFVVAGQLDMSRHIDAGTRQAAGDPEVGRGLYREHCMRCHGEDGRGLEFGGDPSTPEYLGTLASANPWEALHKLRNGHPGSRMPMRHGMMGRWRPGEAMPQHLSLAEEEQAALLAYLQTLPRE